MTVERIETVILNQLVHSEPFFRKVIPHLSEEYFHERIENIIFSIISEHSNKYQAPIKPSILSVKIHELDGMDSDEFSECVSYFTEFLKEDIDSSFSLEELVDETEKFCQEKSVYNGLAKSIAIYEGRDKKHKKEAIPEILTKSLSITFDTNIGHSYIDQASDRYDRWNHRVDKVPFDLEYLNLITGGTKDGRGAGFEPGTLNLVTAGTGAGKTIFMNHVSACFLRQGKNVLYITLEMNEENIAKRIDANLLDLDINKIPHMPKSNFISQIEKLARTGLGKLIIKEYPTATANVNHFRILLDELKIKKNFKPDLICVDYLNICSSSRVAYSQGSFMYVKSIAEEVRGLAGENGVPILSAVQLNRSGIDSSDVGLGNTSDSIGIAYTADWFLALIRTESLDEMGVVCAKQLKNRYTDQNKYRKFLLGLDTSRMKFFDTNQEDEDEDDTPAFDKATDGRTLQGTTFTGIKFD